MERRLLLTCAIICVFGTGCRSDAHVSQTATSRGPAAIQELVSKQATLELTAWRHTPQVFSASDVSLEPLRLHFAGAQIWRASVPIDHFHPYLIAERQGLLYRLGGFGAPDIIELMQFGSDSVPGNEEIVSRAKSICMMLDPNGGEQVILAEGKQRSAAAAQWKSLRPRNWPEDTVLVEVQRGTMVRITALSRNVHSYDQAWTPQVYTFLFNRNGSLSEWAMRKGAPFNVP
jgi:hypothetical protein